MPVPAPPTIPTLPTAPARGVADPVTYVDLADGWAAAQQPWSVKVGETGTWMQARANEVQANADTVATNTETVEEDAAQVAADKATTVSAKNTAVDAASDAVDAKNAAEALYGDLSAVSAAKMAAEAAAATATGAAGTATTGAGTATTKAAEATAAAAASKSYTGGLGFTFSTTTTDSDPGNGNLRLNNASAASATFLYVDNQDADGLSASAWLDTFDDSASALKGTLYLRDGSTGAFAIFKVTGAVVDGTGYRKIPVSYVTGGGSFTNANRVGLAFAATGDVPTSSAVGYVAKTGAYTVAGTDWGKIIDCTSGTFTLSFGTAASLGSGFFCYVKNSGTGVITLPTIDGFTRSLRQGESCLVESDGSNLHWLGLSADQGPHFHSRDEKVSGTPGGSASAGTWQTRDNGTLIFSNISGASLLSNKITLPPGQYHLEARAPAYSCNGHKLRLYNETDSAVVGYGDSAYSANGSAIQQTASLSLDFTISASKVFRLEHYLTNANNTSDLGRASGISGVVEVFSDIQIWKKPQ